MKYSGLMLDFGGVILKTPFEMHRLVEKKTWNKKQYPFLVWPL